MAVETVEEALVGFRRFTEELLRIQETETDPLRAVEAVKDLSRRFEVSGVWPVLDLNKRDLMRDLRKKFKETDVWRKFREAQGTVAEWLYQLLGASKFDQWALIRSEKEWILYAIATVLAPQRQYLMDFHTTVYDGPAPAKYPCLARTKMGTSEEGSSWEADFVYEEDAHALIRAVSGPHGKKTKMRSCL